MDKETKALREAAPEMLKFLEALQAQMIEDSKADYEMFKVLTILIAKAKGL